MALATLPPRTIHSASGFNGLFSPLNYLVKWRMEIVVLWFSKFVWVLLSRERENKKGKRNGKEGICMKEVAQVEGKILVYYLGPRNLRLPSLITLLGWLYDPVYPGQLWSMPSVPAWWSIVLIALSRYPNLDDKSYGGPFKHVLLSAHLISFHGRELDMRCYEGCQGHQGQKTWPPDLKESTAR